MHQPNLTGLLQLVEDHEVGDNPPVVDHEVVDAVDRQRLAGWLASLKWPEVGSGEPPANTDVLILLRHRHDLHVAVRDAGARVLEVPRDLAGAATGAIREA